VTFTVWWFDPLGAHSFSKLRDLNVGAFSTAAERHRSAGHRVVTNAHK